MNEPNYVATVKEREDGQPCSVWIELHQDIGLKPQQVIVFELAAGTDFTHAKMLADALNAARGTVKLV